MFVVRPVGDGTFSAVVDEDWTALQGAHGGYVAALALRAAEAALGGPQGPTDAVLRAATVGFVRGTQVGELSIDVDVVRTGRLLSTSHVRTVQDGKVTTVARFHHSAPFEGVEYSDAPPPAAQPPDTFDIADWPSPRHRTKVDTLVSSSTPIFGGANRAEWLAWSRPVGGDSFDSAWVLMYGDYFPPAVFTRSAGPSRAVTVEYSIQIHDNASSWVLSPGERVAARIHAFHSHDGFAVEDGWIHMPDGRLIATTRQTRLAG